MTPHKHIACCRGRRGQGRLHGVHMPAGTNNSHKATSVQVTEVREVMRNLTARHNKKTESTHRGTGAHGQQQGVLGVAQLHAQLRLDLLQAGQHIFPAASGQLAACGEGTEATGWAGQGGANVEVRGRRKAHEGAHVHKWGTWVCRACSSCIAEPACSGGARRGVRHNTLAVELCVNIQQADKCWARVQHGTTMQAVWACKRESNVGMHASTLTIVVELSADGGGDGQAGGHAQANLGHLSKVGTLATQQLRATTKHIPAALVSTAAGYQIGTKYPKGSADKSGGWVAWCMQVSGLDILGAVLRSTFLI